MFAFVTLGRQRVPKRPAVLREWPARFAHAAIMQNGSPSATCCPERLKARRDCHFPGRFVTQLHRAAPQVQVVPDSGANFFLKSSKPEDATPIDFIARRFRPTKRTEPGTPHHRSDP